MDKSSGSSYVSDPYFLVVISSGHNPSSSQIRTALTSGERTTSASSTNLFDYKPEAVANFHDSGQEGNSVGPAKSKTHSSMLDGTTNLHGFGQEGSAPEAELLNEYL